MIAAKAAHPLAGTAAAQDAAPIPADSRAAIHVMVNGTAHTVDIDQRWTLAEVLRDHLRLTGTKIGCDRGECGACTVLLDGRPVYACSQLAAWVDGRTVETVEGLTRGGEPNALQRAFIAHDAAQCGFCTSGQLMTASALLRTNPRPTRDDARSALVGNICRCSNYHRYVDAVVGAPVSQAPTSGVAALKTVGRTAPRIDAAERVTGRATYTGDLQLPGMLYARVLRSPHPHATIKRIDVSRAAALSGVRTIITHENCQVIWGSGSVAGGQQYDDAAKKITKHQRRVFNNPVRYVGDPVAAVAAVDRHIAEEALLRIAVEYEALPFVLEAEDALKDGAVAIWPEGNLSPDVRGRIEPQRYGRGDVEEGFRSADLIVEDRYTTVHHNNAQMEPRVSLATWDGDRLTLYASTQGVSNCQIDTARDLGIPLENVRVICHYMGGGFGNKNQNQDFDLMAAVLAKSAGAPVKLEFTRKEDFVAVHGRWPTTQYYKVGVRRATGALTAVQLRGYSGMGPYRKNRGEIAGIELYQCPNVDSVVHPVYTNKAVSGNFRGPEFPQGYFGIQSMMDDLAFRLGKDPVECVLTNMTRKFHDEVPYTDYSLDTCIQKGADTFGWRSRWRPPGSDSGALKRGVGMSFMAFRSPPGRSSATMTLNALGRYTLHVGVTDIGAGAKTTMALIAAEALGVPLASVDVVWGDTGRCPFSVGESGSRTTIMTGTAVIEAAEKLKQQIAEKGAPAAGTMLTASATTNPPIPGGRIRNAYGAHFVEVEVDAALGRTRILQYLAVHDCGRIMNPLTALGQIKGAVTMGIGMALHEELLYDRRSGVALNGGYYGARIATHLDAPDIDVIFIETDDGYGPYGAKSMGESGLVPSVAAVANAVFNAIGRRIKSLPMTRDKILGALA